MSIATKLACPRCGDSLEDCEKGLPVRCCAGCDGVLVPQSALQPLLAKLAMELKKDEMLADVIVTIPDQGKGVDCPQCGRAMENYGYLSTNKVQIDGCLPCWLVWTDADELTVMAAMHARSIATVEELQRLNARRENQAAHCRALTRIRRTFRRMR